MIPAFKQLIDKFSNRQSEPGHFKVSEHELRLATAALLVETAMSDFHFSNAELCKMREILGRTYQLDAGSVAALVDQAQHRVDNSISLDQFTTILNANLDPTEKVHLMELLWEVAYADNQIDKYEEYVIRKLADLLHVSHKGYITAKLRVEKGASKPHA